MFKFYRTRACYACDPLVPEDLSINIYSLTKGSRKGCDYAPTATILPTSTLTAAHGVIEGLEFLGGDGRTVLLDMNEFTNSIVIMELAY